MADLLGASAGIAGQNTLHRCLDRLLEPRGALFSHLPTTDGRVIFLQRYTEPEPDVQLLLDRLNLRLPSRPPPRIYNKGVLHV